MNGWRRTYPTPAHERAAAAITTLFATREETDAVLLTNSCARGEATADSCLDMQVIVPPDVVALVDEEWRRHAAGSHALDARSRAMPVLRVPIGATRQSGWRIHWGAVLR